MPGSRKASGSSHQASTSSMEPYADYLLLKHCSNCLLFSTLQCEHIAIDTPAERIQSCLPWLLIKLTTIRYTTICKTFLQPAVKDCRSSSLSKHLTLITDSLKSVDNCFRRWDDEEVRRVVRAFVVEYDLEYKEDIFLQVSKASFENPMCRILKLTLYGTGWSDSSLA